MPAPSDHPHKNLKRLVCSECNGAMWVLKQSEGFTLYHRVSSKGEVRHLYMSAPKRFIDLPA